MMDVANCEQRRATRKRERLRDTLLAKIKEYTTDEGANVAGTT